MTAQRTSGQASTEYVALLLVIAVVLAGAAGAVAAVPGVGDRVARVVRTGICIVGGDLCRPGDAAAAGLPPCVTSERSTRQDTTLDVAVVRLGGHGEWQLALQSDGSAVVTRLAENELGATVGIGLTFSPVGIEGSASATATIGYRGGKAWRFPDAAAARAFLDGARRDASVQAARAPDVRWDALGVGGSAAAQTAISDLARAGLGTTADAAIGLRRDGARRTLTLDLGSEDPGFAVDLPGYPAAPAGVRSVVADVTWEGGAVRELALRTATARDGRLEERTARLDLRDAAEPRARVAAAASRAQRRGPAGAHGPDRRRRRGRAQRLRDHRATARVQRRRTARRRARARARTDHR